MKLPLVLNVSIPEKLTDVIVEEYLGGGAVTTVAKVSLPSVDPDQKFVMKISNRDMKEWVDIETKAYQTLNTPPLNPSIPQLVAWVKSLPNPFEKGIKLLKGLGVPKDLRQALRKSKEVDLHILTMVHHTGYPETLKDISFFLRSLLAALDFAHSRSVMNCDLYLENMAYSNETRTTYLYDWNGAMFYRPGSVRMHTDDEDGGILPPEAEEGPDAVHATVSAFDIYSSGRTFSWLLCGKYFCHRRFQLPEWRGTREQYLVAYDLRAKMLTEDPYERPTARQLLRHPFFSLWDVDP